MNGWINEMINTVPGLKGLTSCHNLPTLQNPELCREAGVAALSLVGPLPGAARRDPEPVVTHTLE